MGIKAHNTALIQKNAISVAKLYTYTLDAPDLTATEQKQDLKQDNTVAQKQKDDTAYLNLKLIETHNKGESTPEEEWSGEDEAQSNGTDVTSTCSQTVATWTLKLILKARYLYHNN